MTTAGQPGTFDAEPHLAADPFARVSALTRPLVIRRRRFDPLVLLVAFSMLFAVAGVSFAAGRMTATSTAGAAGNAGAQTAPFGPRDGRFGPPRGFERPDVPVNPGG